MIKPNSTMTNGKSNKTLKNETKQKKKKKKKKNTKSETKIKENDSNNTQKKTHTQQTFFINAWISLLWANSSMVTDSDESGGDVVAKHDNHKFKRKEKKKKVQIKAKKI